MAIPSFNPVNKGDGYGVPNPKPMTAQFLSSAKIGFPTPSRSARSSDAIPGAPSKVSIEHAAVHEARQLVTDNKVGILASELIGQGVRRGLRTAGGQSIDPNLLQANSRATPVNISGKFVITPASPTAAQLAAANLIAQANFAPGAYPAYPYSDNFAEDCQTGIIQGNGILSTIKIRPSEVLVIDTLGITTFSRAAEYELVWILGYGAVQPTGNVPPNVQNMLIPARRGWPFGDVENPAQLAGRSRMAPELGPTRSGETDVYLIAMFKPATNGAYTPWPHYVEVALRGWKVQIGGDGLALGSNVGGPVMDANAGY